MFIAKFIFASYVACYWVNLINYLKKEKDE